MKTANPYKIFCHQHQPEIQLYLEEYPAYPQQIGEVIFIPHLLPVNRGILSTIYLRFRRSVSEAAIRENLQNFTANKPFVHLLPAGTMPNLQRVRHTNHCCFNVFPDGSGKNWIIVTAIDNLVKGASGQAIQNMNVMYDFAEEAGLI